MHTLKIKDINVIKEGRYILKDISLTFESNKIYGIVGNNGAGKTTLFKVILCLIQYEGVIQFDNYDVNIQTAKKYLKELGYVMPFPEEYNKLTIQELFEEHLHYMGAKLNKDLDDYLYEFGIDKAQTTKIGNLSLGTKQKLNIALALSHNPKIIILDEPFNGLDKKSFYILKKVIKMCKRNDKIILITSHLLCDMEGIMDYIYIFENGKLKISDKESF